jgi:integrase
VGRADFEAVAAHLPAYLQDFARFAYESGWRKGEVATLEWSSVDTNDSRVTLRREHSKNGEPHVLPLVGELAAIIGRRRQDRAYPTLAGETAQARHVFHRRGERVGDFRGAWATACIAAGFARPKVDARYRIVSDDDVRAALERTQSAGSANRSGHNPGHSEAHETGSGRGGDA